MQLSIQKNIQIGYILITQGFQLLSRIITFIPEAK